MRLPISDVFWLARGFCQGPQSQCYIMILPGNQKVATTATQITSSRGHTLELVQ